MKIFDVLLILILVSIIALAVEASTNEGTKDVSAIESKEGERDSLRSATPKPTGQPKKKKENENKWLKSLNNLSRNTGKDSSKQFEKIVNITYANTLNLSNEVYDIFNSLRGNELPVRKIVSRMPKLLTRLTQDQISETIIAITDYTSNITTYAADSINDVWDFRRIFFGDRDRDEKDDGVIPNIFTGVGKTVSGALDSFLGIFTGRSRDDDHN